MSNELLQSFQPDYLLYTHILVIATSFRMLEFGQQSNQMCLSFESKLYSMTQKLSVLF